MLDELRRTSGEALSQAAEKTIGPVDDRKTKRIIGQIDRADAMDRHLHNILVCALYAAAAIIIVMLVCLGWNLAASSEYRFLTDEQQAKLQGFLLSGVVGSGITFAGKRIAGEKVKE